MEGFEFIAAVVIKWYYYMCYNRYIYDKIPEREKERGGVRKSRENRRESF